jgi:tetratricopeptide (TPR) repeat protein
MRHRLADELGAAPGAELRDAYHAVLDATAAPALTQPAPASAAPAQLPAGVDAFTGRVAALRELDDLLAAPVRPGGARVVVLSGTAGVGKTALGLHWAHRVRPRFPDGQLYVNLHGYSAAAPLAPIEALERLLHALEVPPERVPLDPEEAAALYRTRLTDRRVLIMLDNARSADQVRPLLPGTGASLVVVTSRDSLAGLVARDGARRVALQPLSPPEALALLHQLLGTGRVAAEPDAADEVGRLCTYLPLALRIAAAHLGADPDRPISDLVGDLAASDRLARLAVDGDAQAAVGAAFDLSYAALPPDGQRLFRAMGLATGPDLTPGVVAALAGVDPAGAGGWLARLAAAHLVERRGAAYVLPDLLRHYAAQQAATVDSDVVRAAARARLVDYHLAGVAAAAATAYPEVVGLRLPTPPQPGRFASAPAALAWLDTERANLVAAVRHAAAHGPPPVAWRLSSALRGYFRLRRHVVDWIAIASIAADAASASGDAAATAAAGLSLGDAHRMRLRFAESAEHLRAALAAARTADWPEGEAAALVALANGYAQTGDLEAAAHDLGAALAVTERAGLTSGRANMIANLGLMYQELGRLEEAADLQAEAAQVYRGTGVTYSAAVNLTNLGETQLWLGRLAQARASLDEAGRLHREMGNEWGEADVGRVRAALAREEGDLDTALALARSALAGALAADDERSQVDCRNTLGTILIRLGRPAEALAAHEAALALARSAGLHFPATEALIGAAVAGRDPARAREALALAERFGYRMLADRARRALAARRP